MDNVIDLASWKSKKLEENQALDYTLDIFDTITYTLTINGVDCEMEIGEDLVVISKSDD